MAKYLLLGEISLDAVGCPGEKLKDVLLQMKEYEWVNVRPEKDGTWTVRSGVALAAGEDWRSLKWPS